MSQVIFHDVLALEVSRRPGKKKNEATGEYELTGKFWNNLVLYSFGNEYPSLTIASLSEPQLDQVKSFPGKRLDCTLDMKVTAEYGVRFSYLNAVPSKA